MASVTWPIVKPVTRLERTSRRVARWSWLAANYGVERENALAGLIALIALPAALLVSLTFSLPLAFPIALATINLSITGKRSGAAKRAGVAELVLAALLLLVAAFFGVLAVNGAARADALVGVMLSVAFAALPFILRFLMTKSLDRRTVLLRDVEGLDRIAPDERLVVVDLNGRVAAVSRVAMRQFAESGLRPGADLFHLIDSLDRPMLVNALDKAGRHEQVISVRLNTEQCPREPVAARINLSLMATNSGKVILRLQDSPPGLPDRDQPVRSNCPAGPPTNGVDDESACDLEDVVRFAIRLLAGDADKQGVGVTMKERPGRDEKTALLVNCSARIARQIALNVIGNAIKFSHAGGQVTIETDVEGECSLLRVCDQGVGIAKRDRDALFCPHRRGGDRDRPGWGLGLAIVGDLVAGCDGRIFVNSAPGKGTAVTIKLPSAGMEGETERIDLHCLGNQSREIARAA